MKKYILIGFAIFLGFFVFNAQAQVVNLVRPSQIATTSKPVGYVLTISATSSQWAPAAGGSGSSDAGWSSSTINGVIGTLSGVFSNFTFATSGAPGLFIVSSSNSTFTWRVATSSATDTGFLSATDWLTFDGKQNNLGSSFVSSVAVTAPIFTTGNTGAITLSLGINAVSSTRAINTTAPLFGGGDLSADRTLTLGIDAVSSTRAINTGFALSGGGNLSADRTLYFAGTFSSSTNEGSLYITSSTGTWTWNFPGRLNTLAGLSTSTGNLIVGTSTGWTALTVGANGKVLTASSTAPNGVSWQTFQSTASPAGSDTWIQFNDGGSMGADANFKFNKLGNFDVRPLGAIYGYAGAGEDIVFDTSGALLLGGGTRADNINIGVIIATSGDVTSGVLLDPRYITTSRKRQSFPNTHGFFVIASSTPQGTGSLLVSSGTTGLYKPLASSTSNGNILTISSTAETGLAWRGPKESIQYNVIATSGAPDFVDRVYIFDATSTLESVWVAMASSATDIATINFYMTSSTNTSTATSGMNKVFTSDLRFSNSSSTRLVNFASSTVQRGGSLFISMTSASTTYFTSTVYYREQ